ncbi:MAG: tyrosine-type recombinase/integrase [Lyngbya sp. HA4199-MV5]|jgi:integrase/recombinase XerD|nr:tyrosine-type recombinase/integrase [Lyngbya sp. HA4199-MV5]
MSRKSIPEPVILPLQSIAQPTEGVRAVGSNHPVELRSLRVDEFLQARSLAPKSQKAYRQDLQAFLDWTDKAWAEVTPRQIAQFKAHLLRKDIESGQRVLSDATVRRILGTLRNFYSWMVRSRYVSFAPTTEVDLPKLKEPEAQNLKDTEVEQIYGAVALSSLPERNVALVSVLLHGLRAEEVSSLYVEDYDGRRLRIREAKADSKGWVPLTQQGLADLDQYLGWRQTNGEVLPPQSPLFVSYSRRNGGKRLGYDGIRKLMDWVAEQTGIDFHAHQFRHTFATNLVLKGMNPYHVMTLTRHRSVQSFRRYTRAADQAAAEAAFDQITEKSGAIDSKHNPGEPSAHSSQPEPVVIERSDEAVNCEALGESPADLSSTLTTSSKGSAKPERVYQLKVVLAGIRPQIWRRVQVGSRTSLAQLHQILQRVMGWEDYHLHRFSLSEDESLRLDQVVSHASLTFSYTYDFGDEWLHEITVEKILPMQAEQPYPICLAGNRACPQEDCGSSWGYTALLKVLQNPRHPDYQERKEWVGREFDPEAFDLKAVNEQLRNSK